MPDSFDTAAEGTVSVNGSPAYAFNDPSGSDDTAKPTATVNGTKPLSKKPVVPQRPTFAGTAEPGASITVTVHSDPISCTTTAAADGSWSCTLPQSLPAGEHTVYVRVTLADSTVQELGPYAVTVASDGSSNPITDATPGAPTTGASRLAAMKAGSNIIPLLTLSVISIGVSWMVVRRRVR